MSFLTTVSVLSVGVYHSITNIQLYWSVNAGAGVNSTKMNSDRHSSTLSYAISTVVQILRKRTLICTTAFYRVWQISLHWCSESPCDVNVLHHGWMMTVVFSIATRVGWSVATGNQRNHVTDLPGSRRRGTDTRSIAWKRPPFGIFDSPNCQVSQGNCGSLENINRIKSTTNAKNVITLINILGQTEVEPHGKLGTSINFANISLEQCTSWIRTIYVILSSCCHRSKMGH